MNNWDAFMVRLYMRNDERCRSLPKRCAVTFCFLMVAALPGSAVLAAPAPDAPRPDPTARTAPRPAPRPKPAPTPWSKGVSEANRNRALALYKLGNSHFEESRYAQALTEYVKAVKHWNHPAIRYNMAVCYINLDRTMEAYRSLRAALRFGAAPLGRHAKQARTYLRLVKGRLGEIVVECQEAGAKVTLDGQPLFTAPGKAKRLLLTGKHVVVVSKPKYITETKTVVLNPGAKERVRVKLIEVAKSVKMKRRWKNRWMPWTVFGAGLAVAAVGAGLLLLSYQKFKDYGDAFTTECPSGCLPSERPQYVVDLKSEGRMYRAAGWVTAGIGAAAVGAGITLIVLNRARPVKVDPSELENKPRPSDQASILPMLGPGFVGVRAKLRF